MAGKFKHGEIENGWPHTLKTLGLTGASVGRCVFLFYLYFRKFGNLKNADRPAKRKNSIGDAAEFVTRRHQFRRHTSTADIDISARINRGG